MAELSEDARRLIGELGGQAPAGVPDVPDVPDVPEAPAEPQASTGGYPFDREISNAAEAYGVDPLLLRAIARQETNFNPGLVSSKGARGLFQLMPGTAAQYGVTDPFDPYQSAMGGAAYLRDMLDATGGDVPTALAAYNAGLGNVQKYGGIPPFEETQNYVPSVLAHYREMAGGGDVPSPGPQTSAGTATPADGSLSPAARQLIGELGKRPGPPLPAWEPPAPAPLAFAGASPLPRAQDTVKSTYSVADRLRYQPDMQPSTPAALAKDISAQPDTGSPPPAGGFGKTFGVMVQKNVPRGTWDQAVNQMASQAPTPEEQKASGPPPEPPTPLSMYPGVIARAIERAAREGIGIPGYALGAGVGVFEQGINRLRNAPEQALEAAKMGGEMPSQAPIAQGIFKATRLLTQPQPGTPMAQFEEQYAPKGALAHVVDFIGAIPGYAINPVMRLAGKPAEGLGEKILGKTVLSAAQHAAGVEFAMQVANGVSERKAARIAVETAKAIERVGAGTAKSLITRYLAEPATQGFVFGVMSTVPEVGEDPNRYALRALVQGGETAPMFAFYSLSAGALRRVGQMIFGYSPPEFYGRLMAQVMQKNKTGEALTPEELEFAKWIVEEAQRRGFDVNLASREPDMAPRPPTMRPQLPPGAAPPLALGPGPEYPMLPPGPSPTGGLLTEGLPPGWAPLQDPRHLPSPIENAMWEMRASKLQVNDLRNWIPWVTENEIQSASEGDRARLVEVAKARMAAYRESELVRLANPEEQAMLGNPNAPRGLILKMIEDRLSTQRVQAEGQAELSGQPYKGPGATPVLGAEMAPGGLAASLPGPAAPAVGPPAAAGAAPVTMPPAGGIAPSTPPVTVPPATPTPAALPPPPGQTEPAVSAPIAPEDQEYDDTIRQIQEMLGQTVTGTPASPSVQAPVVPGDVGPTGAKPEPADVVGPEPGTQAAEVPFQKNRRKTREARNEEESVRFTANQLIQRLSWEKSPEEVNAFFDAAIKTGEPDEERAKVFESIERRFKYESSPQFAERVMAAMSEQAISKIPHLNSDVHARLLGKHKMSIIGRLGGSVWYDVFQKPIDATDVNARDESGALVKRLQNSDPGMWVSNSGRSLMAVSRKTGMPPDAIMGSLRTIAQTVQARDVVDLFKDHNETLKDIATSEPASLLKEGESFMADDGVIYKVLKADDTEVLVQYDHPETGETMLGSLRPTDMVPIVDRLAETPATVGRLPRPGYGGGALGRVPREEDAWAKAAPQLKQLLVKAGVYQFTKGVRDPAAFSAALEGKLGPVVRPYVQGLLKTLESLPAFKGGKGGPAQSQPTAPGPAGAPGGTGIPAPQPGGPGPGPAPGPEGPAPPSPPQAPVAPEKGQKPSPGGKKPVVPLDPHRLVREGGVATPNYDLYPALTQSLVDAAKVDFFEKKFGFRPLAHQVENVNRAAMAFEKEHSFLVGDSTGTGKTATAAMIVDRLFFDRNPDARIIYLVKNHDLRTQATNGVFAPLRIKTRDYAQDGNAFRPGKRQINFITYSKAHDLLGKKKKVGNTWAVIEPPTIGKIKDFNPDLIIVDESQELRNWYLGVQTALAGEQMTRAADKTRTLFLSATPYESVLHTGYLSTLKLWWPKEDWGVWMGKTLGVRWDEAQQNWIGLSPKKLKNFYNSLLMTGRMTKSEIDFHSIKDKSGKPLTMHVKMRMVPMEEEQEAQYERVNNLFEEMLLETEKGVDRRVIASMRYMVIRALDESQKVDTAVALAKEALKRNMMPVITTFRKGDTDFEKMLQEFHRGERKYSVESIMPFLLDRLKDEIKIESPVQRIAKAFPTFVHITGDQPSGGWARKANMESIHKNTADGVILTMRAGGTGISVHDEGGPDGKTLRPRAQINISLPDTAMEMTQVSGRTFRLGSQSDTTMFWLYNDTPSQKKKAKVVGYKNAAMGAAVEGLEENPTADELIKFDFPEIGSEDAEIAGKPGRHLTEPQEEEPKPVQEKPHGAMGREEREGERPAAPVRYRGYQEGLPGKAPGFDVWDLTEDIPGHKRGSTVGTPTLEKLGYMVPAPPAAPEEPVMKAEDLEGAPGGAQPYAAKQTTHVPQNIAGNVEQVKSRYRQVLSLTKALGVLFAGKGRMNTRRAMAWYKPGLDVTRAKMAADIDSIAHECGHRLSKMLFGYERPWNIKGIKRAPEMHAFHGELLAISTPPHNREEGFAEFIRLYITDRTKAQQVCPTFFPYFETLLSPPSSRPKLRDWVADRKNAASMALQEKANEGMRNIKVILDGAQADYDSHTRGSDEAVVGSTIESASIPGGRQPKYLPWVDFQRFMLDDMYPFRWAEDKLLAMIEESSRGYSIAPVWSPRMLASVIAGRWMKALSYANDYTFHYSSPGQKKGEPLRKIFEDIGKQWWEYEMYAKSKRALDLRDQRGWDPFDHVGFHADRAERTVAKYRSLQPFYTRQKNYSNGLLDYLVEAGMMTPAMRRDIAKWNIDYSPLMRVFDPEERLGRGIGGSQWANQWSPIKRIKGDDHPTMPAIEALYKMTLMIHDRVEKNRLLMGLVELSDFVSKGLPGTAPEGVGTLVEKVPKERWPMKVSVGKVLGEVNAIIKKKYPGTAPVTPQSIGVSDKILGELIELWQDNVTPPEEPYVWGWKNGERQYYKVHPYLYDALMHMDAREMNWVMNLMSRGRSRWMTAFGHLMTGGARGLRFGAVGVSPRYWGRAVFRDIPAGAFYSDNPLLWGFYMVKTAAEMFNAGRKGEVAPIEQKYMAGGGGMGTFVGLRPEDVGRYIQRSLYKSREPEKARRDPKFIAMQLLQGLQMVGQGLDLLPRISEARVHGLDKATGISQVTGAVYHGRENPQDYNRIGLLARFINSMSAFYGANAGGKERFFREALREHPVRFWWRLMLLIGIPSFLYYMYQRHDKRWRDWPQSDKDRNWIIFPPEVLKAALPKDQEWWADAPIRLPKPYDLADFGNGIERGLEAWDYHDPQSMEALLLHMYQDSPADWTSMVPDTFLPMLEVYMNQDTRFNRPIHPERGEDVVRYYPTTTETSKKGAQALYDASGGRINIAPADIDYLASAYTGGLGRGGLRAADLLAGGAKKLPGQMTDVPVIGGFYGRAGTLASETTERFYKSLDNVRMVKQTLSIYRKQDPDRADAYAKEHESELMAAKFMEATARRVGPWRDEYYKIREDPTLDPNVKMQKMIEVSDQIKEMLGEAMDKLYGPQGPQFGRQPNAPPQ